MARQKRWTIVTIDKQTGVANTLHIGWGEASHRSERAALEEIKAFEDRDRQYGHERDYVRKALAVPRGYESCAARWYNEEHGLA